MPVRRRRFARALRAPRVCASAVGDARANEVGDLRLNPTGSTRRDAHAAREFAGQLELVNYRLAKPDAGLDFGQSQ